MGGLQLLYICLSFNLSVLIFNVGTSTSPPSLAVVSHEVVALPASHYCWELRT